MVGNSFAHIRTVIMAMHFLEQKEKVTEIAVCSFVCRSGIPCSPGTDDLIVQHDGSRIDIAFSDNTCDRINNIRSSKSEKVFSKRSVLRKCPDQDLMPHREDPFFRCDRLIISDLFMETMSFILFWELRISRLRE